MVMLTYSYPLAASRLCAYPTHNMSVCLSTSSFVEYQLTMSHVSIFHFTVIILFHSRACRVCLGRCNALQHTLQHTATHIHDAVEQLQTCSLQHTATHCNTRRNTLHHTAKHCYTHWWGWQAGKSSQTITRFSFELMNINNSDFGKSLDFNDKTHHFDMNKIYRPLRPQSRSCSAMSCHGAYGSGEV